MSLSTMAEKFLKYVLSKEPKDFVVVMEESLPEELKANIFGLAKELEDEQLVKNVLPFGKPGTSGVNFRICPRAFDYNEKKLDDENSGLEIDKRQNITNVQNVYNGPVINNPIGNQIGTIKSKNITKKSKSTTTINRTKSINTTNRNYTDNSTNTTNSNIGTKKNFPDWMNSFILPLIVGIILIFIGIIVTQLKSSASPTSTSTPTLKSTTTYLAESSPILNLEPASLSTATITSTSTSTPTTTPTPTLIPPTSTFTPTITPSNTLFPSDTPTETETLTPIPTINPLPTEPKTDSGDITHCSISSDIYVGVIDLRKYKDDSSYEYSNIISRLTSIGINAEWIEPSTGYRSLGKFHILYLPSWWALKKNEIEANNETFRAFVEDGRGLLIEQPNSSSKDFQTSIVKNKIDFSDSQYGDSSSKIIVPDHFLTIGLDDNQMPIPLDQLKLIDSKYYTVLVTGKNNDWPSLVISNYGMGRILLNMGNASPTIGNQGYQPISNDSLCRMFKWLAKEDK